MGGLYLVKMGNLKINDTMIILLGYLSVGKSRYKSLSLAECNIGH